MKQSTHIVRDVLVTALSFVALVGAALVIEGGGFAIAIGLIAIALLAPLVALAFIVHEEDDVGRHGGGARAR